MNLIPCTIFDLAQRSIQRGYDFIDVKDCIVEKHNNKIIVDVDHKKYPLKPKTNPSSHQIGPGTELSNILRKFGFKITPNCSCKQRAILMNFLGNEWCKNNIEIILKWLEEEAKKRKIIFIKRLAKILVNNAIKKSIKINDLHNHKNI